MTPPGPIWKLAESLREFAETGDEDFVAELLDVFKTQTADRLRLMREALEQGRADVVRAQAHAIKGGSSQVGADRLAAICLEIEIGSAQADTGALIAQAEIQFEEVCRLMSAG